MIIKFLKAVKKKITRAPNHYPIRKGKKRNFIFIHINKTGGTSVAKTIGLPHINHLTVPNIIEIVGQENFDAAFKFTVVRNPWSKVVSHYNFRIATNQTNMGDGHITFKDWVKCTYGKDKNTFYYDNVKMFQPQVDWLKDSEGRIVIENRIRFENIEEDFKKIANIIGVKNNLPHLKSTKKVDYKTFYDDETKEIVREWFQEDLAVFGYTFEK